MGIKSDYLGIEIQYDRDVLLPKQGYEMLTKDGLYKIKGETSPQQGFARAATAYCFGDYDFAQRMYDYMSKKWFTNASPVLSNAVEVDWGVKVSPEFAKANFNHYANWLEENVTPTGLPISCFLSMIPDTKEGLLAASSETRSISMNGGGIGIMPKMRSPDSMSTGVMAHMRGYDADALAYKQKESRRGSIAAYMDIDHPEIMSFMAMRDPVGGDTNKKCFNMNNGVNIPDSFMHKMFAGEEYELVDPKYGPTGRMLPAREVWDRLMDLRFETGEPYIQFIDTVNRAIPKQITNPDYKVIQSNLCSEITLFTNKFRTAVCCLSSLNMDLYHEWKDTQLVQDVIRYLDNVLEYFIRLAPPELERAVYSAKMERALGLGTLGWHSYLQRNSIPFESGGFNSNVQHTNIIFKELKKRCAESSMQLALERGEPFDCAGSGYRNSHFMAIAPNASTSSLINVSPGIELWKANVLISAGRSGMHIIKNPHLKTLLNTYNKDTDEVWLDINKHKGSVQHLEFLSEHEKRVFKTSFEVDQMWVIEVSGHRTPYVCQSSSLNIFQGVGTTKQYMSDLHVKAWENKTKTLYYCRTQEPVTASTEVKQPLNRVDVKISYEDNACLGCDG
jgi:ribonucleoside-diphosphate reductase alpha chain